MKKALAIISFAFVMASCSSSKDGSSTSKFALDTTKVASGKTFYQCPMHLEVLSSESGDCPKCGMALESVVKQ